MSPSAEQSKAAFNCLQRFRTQSHSNIGVVTIVLVIKFCYEQNYPSVNVYEYRDELEMVTPCNITIKFHLLRIILRVDGEIRLDVRH